MNKEKVKQFDPALIVGKCNKKKSAQFYGPFTLKLSDSDEYDEELDYFKKVGFGMITWKQCSAIVHCFPYWMHMLKQKFGKIFTPNENKI
mmetsp:Transcript_50477/g.76812  ORF Transcript_50477/g.76812 Transcript_50477/m.76812 type:complete len:90 (-) Transcript_50477:286-555(-)